jgi:hypothetical protein
MTINHVFLIVHQARLPVLRAFYKAVLQPLGYTEMLSVANNTLIGYGTDYPYLWLKGVPEDQVTMPTHVAIDAPDQAAVAEFHRIGL